MRYIIILLAVMLSILASQLAISSQHEITVSAAASLTDTFTEIGKLYQKKHPGVNVKFNFASSGALAAQIEQGAPVDVFVSADPKFVDKLAKADLIVAPTRRNIASNQLVVVTPAGSKLKIKSLSDLKSTKVNRIGIGDPESVPAGKYAKQALVKTGVWNAVKGKLVFGSDVRQVRTYVERDEVDAGFVFRTDVSTSTVKAAYTVPESLHDPIVYSAAAIKQSPNQSEAKGFVAFLATSASRKVLAKYGFAPPGK